MISIKSMDKIREMHSNGWHYKAGIVYSNGSTSYHGDSEVRRFMCEILDYEKLNKDYLISEGETKFDFIVSTKADIRICYTITLVSSTIYYPIDIYGKLSRAIEILNLKSVQAAKLNAYKNSLNGFYGMYVDTDSIREKSYMIKEFFSPKNPKFPAIRKVISNKPYSIVLWEDGTKTIVKQQPGETKYDPEKGLAMCIVKKMYGNNKWYDIFKRNLDPKYTKRKKVK